MPIYKIGDIEQMLGVSKDTLRYYEKIKLLPTVTRTEAGIRQYGDKDISRLRFIRRAQKMNFSLAEIASLMKMRDDPVNSKADIRELTANKLKEIEENLAELDSLRGELRLLLNLCNCSADGCPIIENLETLPNGNSE